MTKDVELRQLRIFLALADELHFGRTAERLGISQPGVSEAVRVLEARLGARLFERTSRRVRLTPIGDELRRQVAPACQALDTALAGTRDLAVGVAGPLRIGITPVTGGPALDHLVGAFQAEWPGCAVSFHEIAMYDPYAALRRCEIDVLVNWLAGSEPDLTAGPAITWRNRVLAVARDHRLATRASVVLEDLSDEHVAALPPSFPAALADAIIPPRTPSGRPIRRTQPASSLHEIFALVARGELVHPTMSGLTFLRADLVLVPIEDLPPMPLGLIWRTACENAKIRALAQTARSIRPNPPRKQRPGNLPPAGQEPSSQGPKRPARRRWQSARTSEA